MEGVPRHPPAPRGPGCRRRLTRPRARGPRLGSAERRGGRPAQRPRGSRLLRSTRRGSTGTRRTRRAGGSGSRPATLPANMIVAPNSPAPVPRRGSARPRAPASRADDDPAEDRPLAAAVDARRVLEVAMRAGEGAAGGADEERRRDERLRQHDRRRGERDLQPGRRRMARADRAGSAARDRRRPVAARSGCRRARPRTDDPGTGGGRAPRRAASRTPG